MRGKSKLFSKTDENIAGNSSSQGPNPQHSFRECVLLEYFLKELERARWYVDGPIMKVLLWEVDVIITASPMGSDPRSTSPFKVG